MWQCNIKIFMRKISRWLCKIKFVMMDKGTKKKNSHWVWALLSGWFTLKLHRQPRWRVDLRLHKFERISQGVVSSEWRCRHDKITRGFYKNCFLLWLEGGTGELRNRKDQLPVNFNFKLLQWHELFQYFRWWHSPKGNTRLPYVNCLHAY